MSQSFRKNLSRVVAFMGALLVFAFIAILLNGTLNFSSNTAFNQPVEDWLNDISVGDVALRKNADKLAWVVHLSREQLTRAKQFVSSEVKLGVGCQDLLEVLHQGDKQVCVISAATDKTGIYIQFTELVPAQLPGDLPWQGGFVNPLNGAVYDRLGRAYVFQGEVKELLLIKPE